MEKEAKERLGWNGIQEIQSHPYFQSIDWTLAANRQLTPPYVPVIKDEADVSHFDELFTNMPVRISQSSDVQQDPFDSFDFDLSSSSLVDPQKNQNTGGSCCNRNRQGSSMQVCEIDEPTRALTASTHNSVYSALTVENHFSSVVEPYYFFS